MKTPYNTALTPPAPFLSVRVASLANVDPIDLFAKVDTGADVTAIPTQLVSRLNLSPADEIVVEAYDGRQMALLCYDIVLRIDRWHLVGLPVITFAEAYVLLERDVLNHLRLLLDGPGLTTEMVAP